MSADVVSLRPPTASWRSPQQLADYRAALGRYCSSLSQFYIANGVWTMKLYTHYDDPPVALAVDDDDVSWISQLVARQTSGQMVSQKKIKRLDMFCLFSLRFFFFFSRWIYWLNQLTAWYLFHQETILYKYSCACIHTHTTATQTHANKCSYAHAHCNIHILSIPIWKCTEVKITSSPSLKKVLSSCLWSVLCTICQYLLPIHVTENSSSVWRRGRAPCQDKWATLSDKD